MAIEFEGDKNNRRHLFYRCTAGRPDVASNTKEDNIEPNERQLSISAMPRLENHFVKASIDDAASIDAYSSWYGNAPYEPVVSEE